jgi:type IV pilus assembly protein PilV
MNPEKAYITSAETQMGKLKKEEGFTLIEVLIAITIFAVGLLAVAAMQTSAIKMNSTAGKLTNLSTWGMDKIEELSALPYTNPWLEMAGNPGNPPPATDSAGNTHVQVSGDYTISWTVIDDNPLTSTKKITVTVTGRGKTAVISFLKPNV